MSSGLEQSAVHFIQTYGYVALFVLLALETAMILHFVPSEVIVTVAAATLATNMAQLILVILISTLGATTGSLMLYAFARYGGRRFLDRHPHFFGLNAKRRARLEAWFHRPAGESLVFFFRLLPFLRAAVSIPAGLVSLDARKFTLYSAAGSLVFNTALAYSAYAARMNPDVMAGIREAIAYATSRWPFFLALTFIGLFAVYMLYRRRAAYRQTPHLAVQHVLHISAISAVAAGVILVAFSLAAPHATYRAVTWIAVDAGQLAEQYHVSGLLFLFGIAFGAITLGLVVLTASPLLERGVDALFEYLRTRARKSGRG